MVENILNVIFDSHDSLGKVVSFSYQDSIDKDRYVSHDNWAALNCKPKRV